MRDSSLKRFLLGCHFSALEVRTAIRGMVAKPCTNLGQPNYDDYWRHRPLSDVQPRFQLIASGLKPGERLLDVGCGDGAMLSFLREHRGVDGVGIDVSPVAVEKARSRGVQAHVRLLSEALNDPNRSAFDHVVVSEVLEHVANPEELVQQGWAIARKTLWLTFPNIAYFPHRLRLICGRFPVQWVLFPGEHLRFWSLCDFRKWLMDLGMPTPRILPSNGLIVGGLHRVWPNLLANQIVVRLDKHDAI